MSAKKFGKKGKIQFNLIKTVKYKSDLKKRIEILFKCFECKNYIQFEKKINYILKKLKLEQNFKKLKIDKNKLLKLKKFISLKNSHLFHQF